jgi:hypothetical protein
MESNKVSKSRVKLFNNVYKDMQSKIKVVLKKTQCKSFEITKAEQLKVFSEQMDKYKNLFDSKDVELLKKVDLLSQFFKDKPTLSSVNKESVWQFIQALYSLSSGVKKELVKQPEPLDLTKLGTLVNNLMSDDSNGFGNLVKDISSKLEGTLGDKNLDQTKILQDLMAGKTESGGINCGVIISQASKTLKEKVDLGEIDVSKMAEVANGLAGELNLNKNS